MIELPKEIADQLYETRVIVLLESKPQSNKYHQLLLTRDQFKQVTDTIVKVYHNPLDLPGNFNPIGSAKSYTLDENIQSNYTHESITKNM